MCYSHITRTAAVLFAVPPRYTRITAGAASRAHKLEHNIPHKHGTGTHGYTRVAGRLRLYAQCCRTYRHVL